MHTREVVFETSSLSPSYETPIRAGDKRETDENDDDDDGDETNFEEDVRKFGSTQFGSVASPYLAPYLYNKRFLYRQYGSMKEGNVFKIGDSSLTLDEQSDIRIQGKNLWEQ
jgi:hypothetical protein